MAPCAMECFPWNEMDRALRSPGGENDINISTIKEGTAFRLALLGVKAFIAVYTLFYGQHGECPANDGIASYC
jgi:hypothetical protein